MCIFPRPSEFCFRLRVWPPRSSVVVGQQMKMSVVEKGAEEHTLLHYTLYSIQHPRHITHPHARLHVEMSALLAFLFAFRSGPRFTHIRARTGAAAERPRQIRA
jgi:hypothetical protein